jgi:hypothetical protein
MIIEVIDIKSIGARTKRQLRCSCDECGSLMIKSFGERFKELQFCDRNCASKSSQKNQKIRIKIEKTISENDPDRVLMRRKYKQTSLFRYGVMSPSQAPHIRQKISRSTKKAMSDWASEKAKKGIQKRFGNEFSNSFQVPEIRQKIINTFSGKYGGKSPMCSPVIVSKLDYESIKVKAMNTCLMIYGVAHPMQSDVVRLKFAATCIRRYGVPHPSMNPETRERYRLTCQARYGVDCTFSRPETIALAQRPEIKRRAFETLKNNGMNYVSQIEHRFGESMKSYLNPDDVQTQVWVHRWPIDFYIKSIDTYVQFDGVYWHGTHKTFNELARSSVSRDKSILLKKKRDIEQNKWFVDNNMKLVRYTDEQFKTAHENAHDFILEILK